MYYVIKQAHFLFVVLYLIFYGYKVVLLLLSKNEQLIKFRKQTRWIEITLSVLFLGTGVYLIFESGMLSYWFYGKVFLLLFIIVSGIWAFRALNKTLGLLSLVALVYVFGISETKSLMFSNPLKQQPHKTLSSITTNPHELGRKLYTRYCVQCHGEAGDLGLSGAANLKTSRLTEQEIEKVIRNGRLAMPGFGNVFNEGEMKALVEYTKNLQVE